MDFVVRDVVAQGSFIVSVQSKVPAAPYYLVIVTLNYTVPTFVISVV